MNRRESEPNCILFFDGVCNLCNGIVRFILKHDRKKRIKLAPLQSELTEKLLAGRKIEAESVVYYRTGKIHQQSAGILYVLKDLGFPWSLFFVFIIIPPFIRNFIYRLVANNRYKIFGRRNECVIPDEQNANRLLKIEHKSNIKHHTSNIWYLISIWRNSEAVFDIRCPMSEVWCVMSDQKKGASSEAPWYS